MGIEELFIERYRAVVETGEVAQFEHRAEALGRAYRVIAYRTRPGEFATIFADNSSPPGRRREPL